MDGVDNVKVKVSEITSDGSFSYTLIDSTAFVRAPRTFTTAVTNDSFHIEFGFDPIAGGTRTYLLEYDVLGGLRVRLNSTPPNQQV